MNLKHLNILLADDDMDDCIFFKEALEGLLISSSLTIVNDGEQLMEFLLKEDQQLPDVLFLDLNMHRKNGFECLAEIKLSEKLNPLPVIIFSTFLDKYVVDVLYQNGAQYFIRKPSVFSHFKKIIHTALSLIAQEKAIQPKREDFVLTENIILNS